MKVRFQADADFSQRIVSAVRRQEPAIDFQHANVLELRGLADPEVLTLAARDGRLLVSHDLTNTAVTVWPAFAWPVKGFASSNRRECRRRRSPCVESTLIVLSTYRVIRRARVRRVLGPAAASGAISFS